MTSCFRRISLNTSERPIQHLGHQPRLPASEISFLTHNKNFNKIVLQTKSWNKKNLQRVISYAGAVDSDGVPDRSNSEECSRVARDLATKAEYKTVENGNRTVEVIVAAAITVVFGVGNRVLYKLALVPLKHYPFFLAQIATFGYVIVYFSILYLRYQAGIITNEMLSLPKAPFLVVGLLEALGAATGMAAGAILSGASIPILSQTFLVWQILLSVVFLRRRYRVNQLLGCFLVAIGVIITVARFYIFLNAIIIHEQT